MLLLRLGLSAAKLLRLGPSCVDGRASHDDRASFATLRATFAPRDALALCTVALACFSASFLPSFDCEE